MTSEEQGELARRLEAACGSMDGTHTSAIPGVHCLRFSEPGVPVPVVVNPSLCVIVQGAKQVLLEDEIYRYAPSEFLVISVDLPVTGLVTSATADEPYLCLQVDLDAHTLAEVHAQTSPPSATREATRGIFVGTLNEPFTDSLLRLARLLSTPRDIPALAPLVIREIHYRLLSHERGQQIAQIAVRDSAMQRIARVLRTIKMSYSGDFRVEEMANMSPSSFHSHFKAVTAMSPLQYVKRLRLLEARRMLVAGEADASRAGLRVGYESPSQFSREYARMFGAPPARDAGRLRQQVI